MDADRKSSTGRSRRSNEHSWEAHTAEGVSDSTSAEGLSAMMTQQQAASSMNRQTWGSLSDSTKKAWDTISPSDKAKILAYAEDRAQRRNTGLQANVADVTEDDSGANDPQDEAAGDSSESPSMEANAAKSVQETNAGKSSAHPGDVRRMMGKQTPSRPTRAGNTVRWEINSARRTDTAPSSDVWGGDSGTTSSQLLPPSTSPSPDALDLWGTSQPSSPDTFDLFGTDLAPNTVTSTFTTEKQNPFKPQYDPFADIWADEEAQHFW